MKIRYGWGFNLFKILKEGTAKVRLGSYLGQEEKNRYNWGFFGWNCSNKVLLGFSSIEYAKIKDDGVLISLKC